MITGTFTKVLSSLMGLNDDYSDQLKRMPCNIVSYWDDSILNQKGETTKGDLVSFVIKKTVNNQGFSVASDLDSFKQWFVNKMINDQDKSYLIYLPDAYSNIDNTFVTIKHGITVTYFNSVENKPRIYGLPGSEGHIFYSQDDVIIFLMNYDNIYYLYLKQLKVNKSVIHNTEAFY